MAPVDPPSPSMLDPQDVGQSFRAPVTGNGDEFGYSVAFGRVLTTTGSDEDAIVGARGAGGGAGSVTVFAVDDGVVDTTVGRQVRIVGLDGDGLGEVLAAGDSASPALLAETNTQIVYAASAAMYLNRRAVARRISASGEAGPLVVLGDPLFERAAPRPSGFPPIWREAVPCRTSLQVCPYHRTSQRPY